MSATIDTRGKTLYELGCELAKPAFSLSLTSTDIKRVNSLEKFCASDTTRPILTRPCLHGRYAVATDTHRMAIVRTESEQPLPPDTSYLMVDFDGTHSTGYWTGKEVRRAGLVVSDTRVFTTWGVLNFPNWQRVVPESEDRFEFTINCKDLSEALTSIKHISKEAAHRVTLTFSGDMLVVSAFALILERKVSDDGEIKHENTEVSDYKPILVRDAVNIAVDGSGMPAVAFNGKYLLDAMTWFSKIFKADSVRFSLHARDCKSRAIKAYPVGTSGDIASPDFMACQIIMPMSLEAEHHRGAIQFVRNLRGELN